MEKPTYFYVMCHVSISNQKGIQPQIPSKTRKCHQIFKLNRGQNPKAWRRSVIFCVDFKMEPISCDGWLDTGQGPD